jgi:acyl-CoA reductase-like NAD-dependent aldehyde dehydrogenase
VVASAAPKDVTAAIDQPIAPGKAVGATCRPASARRPRGAYAAEHQEDLACSRAQIGKPISDARDEAGLGARCFEYYAGAVTKFGGQTLPVARGGFDFTLRQPMGVVACIVPWNCPGPIAAWKAAPALATGNCVVRSRPRSRR